MYCLQVYSSGVHYCLENGLTASLMEGERAGRTERERRERGKGGRERREKGGQYCNIKLSVNKLQTNN